MSGLDLPEGEFDKLITFKLVRKQTNAIKKQLLNDPYLKFISSSCTFDFLPSKNKKSEPTVIYELPVRIVRFKISDDSYEVIATNLSEDLFSSDDLKMLYSMRWRIETSFQDLKYTVGLRYFHAILFLDFISLMILIESHASFLRLFGSLSRIFLRSSPSDAMS